MSAKAATTTILLFKRLKMESSIVSYKNRGNYGKSSYRGNCSGLIIKAMLNYLRPRVFVDTTLGGGTSADVVRELNQNGRNIEFYGLDLHNGFNLLKDSLSERVGGQRADYVFIHPPYHSVIKFSGLGNQWGTEAHPDDLSHCPTYEAFLAKMTIALRNIYESLSRNGSYSILVGDLRKDGEYISIQSDLLQLAPGKLDGIVIKAQHNCVSDRRTYSGRFIPIMHEYLINLKKTSVVFGMIDTTLNVSRKLEMLSRANWSAVIQTALTKLGGQARLPEIYEAIEADAPQTTRPRPNWQARVRATLQAHFRPVERGVWALC